MDKLKLKDSVSIFKEKEDEYTFLFNSTRKLKKFTIDNLVKEIIENLKSEKTEVELFSDLSKRYKQEQISDCLSALEKEGIIRRYNENFNKKYSKQLLFIDELTNSWEETLSLQKKIEDSKIAVFGIGGIGTWMVNSLSQMGVGEIRVVDTDKVEESNLNRQLFFDSTDIGKYKIDVIKQKLVDTTIIPFKKEVKMGESLDEIVSSCNFLVNCADSPSVEVTTKIIDGYSSKYNIPYCIAGGYNLHLGMVGPIILPGKTASLNDFIEYQKKNNPLEDLDIIKDVTQTGNLGPIAGTIANIQAMEIFKYLIGKGESNINKFAEIDFMNFNINWINF